MVPLRELEPDRFRAALALQQRDEAETDPDTPPITEEELRRFATDDRSDGNRHERYALVDGDEVRVVAHLELEHDPENAHIASAEIFGLAHHLDAARLALAHMLDVAESDSRTSFMAWGPNSDTHHGFWTAAGGVRQYIERLSALDTTVVDPGLMAEWIEQRNERAGDVELVRWVGPAPEEHMAAWIRSRNAMNDAPTDGLDINDYLVTEADIREDEDARTALGTRLMHILGLTPDGEPVGHTSVHVNTFRPAASGQWDTVVLDAHRRRGIGRWLKAEMWRWLREVEPDVTRLLTGNAESNDPMLGINVAMGYRPVAEFAVWQAPISAYRAASAAG